MPSSPPLIDYVLLAEFDIDRGSTLRASYPAAIRGLPPSLEGRLAELMLPDGAHLRSTDETCFLLHGALPPPAQQPLTLQLAGGNGTAA